MKHHATIRMGAAHDELILNLKGQGLSFDMSEWGMHKRQRIAREVLHDAQRGNEGMTRARSALGAL